MGGKMRYHTLRIKQLPSGEYRKTEEFSTLEREDNGTIISPLGFAHFPEEKVQEVGLTACFDRLKQTMIEDKMRLIEQHLSDIKNISRAI